MKFFTAKKMMALLLPACMVFTMAGCTRSVSAAAYKTVNGVTEGNYEVSTDDKGSASFDVHDNHVEMTNFSFDADHCQRGFRRGYPQTDAGKREKHDCRDGGMRQFGCLCQILPRRERL